MAAATNNFYNPGSEVENIINSPFFYDFQKICVSKADYVPGEVGTVGILILHPDDTALAAQNLGTGAVTASVIDTMTLTPRGSAAKYLDYPDNAAGIALQIWSHEQPYFFPGDFERIALSTSKARYIVVLRKLRQYE